MTRKVIKVATDFYDAPAGRFPEDGDYHGERFRNENLLPALKGDGEVLVDLDNTEGYGSSFLEEAFGGLVRLCGYTATELHDRLSLKSDEDESIVHEIWEYIDTARPEKGSDR